MEVQGTSSACHRAADLACGTYKAYAPYLHSGGPPKKMCLNPTSDMRSPGKNIRAPGDFHLIWLSEA